MMDQRPVKSFGRQHQIGEEHGEPRASQGRVSGEILKWKDRDMEKEREREGHRENGWEINEESGSKREREHGGQK